MISSCPLVAGRSVFQGFFNDLICLGFLTGHDKIILKG